MQLLCFVKMSISFSFLNDVFADLGFLINRRGFVLVVCFFGGVLGGFLLFFQYF